MKMKLEKKSINEILSDDNFYFKLFCDENNLKDEFLKLQRAYEQSDQDEECGDNV